MRRKTTTMEQATKQQPESEGPKPQQEPEVIVKASELEDLRRRAAALDQLQNGSGELNGKGLEIAILKAQVYDLMAMKQQVDTEIAQRNQQIRDLIQPVVPQ
jgi:hypothetical protein